MTPIISAPDGLLDGCPVPVGFAQHKLGYSGLDAAVVETVPHRPDLLPFVLLESECLAAAGLHLLRPLLAGAGLVGQRQPWPLSAVTNGAAPQCEY